jgi:hypothetical protein
MVTINPESPWGRHKSKCTARAEGLCLFPSLFPKSVHLLIVVLPLARFTAYFLHVNMAKCNNRI